MELKELLNLCSSRHEHLCPRQVLGVRMGLAGLARINLPAPMPHKAAMVIIETVGCFADGIEVATGATVGHRTLRVVDQGKIAAVFSNIVSGQSVRLAPREGVRQLAREYAPGIKTLYTAQLKGYQVMPEEELFSFQTVELDPSLQELLSRPGLRIKCSQCGEEISNDRQLCIDGKVFCQTCGGIKYYRLG